MSAIGSARTRTLDISSSAIPVVLGRPALEPVRLSGREGLNSLFEYELLLKTPDALNLGASGAIDFDLDGFIGREICCSVQLDGAGQFIAGVVGASRDHVGAGVREINALITDACLLGEEGRHVQYRLTLRPWLHLATLTTDCKIFQNKTIVQILDELLSDYDFPVDKRLIESYPTRDYQVQYNESDFEFFSRLCEEWGISYFFEHSEGKHRLVLIDNMGAYKKNHSAAYQEVEYHAPGWKVDAEYVHSFVPHHQLTSGKYASREYDYTRPRADLGIGRSDPRATGQADGEPERGSMVPRTYETVGNLGAGERMSEYHNKVQGQRKTASLTPPKGLHAGASAQELAAYEKRLRDWQQARHGNDSASVLDSVQAVPSDPRRELEALGIKPLVAMLMTFDADREAKNIRINSRDSQAQEAQAEQEAKTNKSGRAGDVDDYGVDIVPKAYREIYIHSKLMLVDDVYITLGSANLNARSMVSDSEFNICAADYEFTQAARRKVWENVAGKDLDGGDGSPQITAKTHKAWVDRMDANKTNRKASTPEAPIAGSFIHPFEDLRGDPLVRLA